MNKTQLPGAKVYSIGSDGFWTWTCNGTRVLSTPEEGVDLANDAALHRNLTAAAANSPVVVVDGTFFSVSAMRVLDQVGRMMAAAGGELRVVLPTPRKCGYLELARYHEHVRAFLTLAEAVAAAQDRRPWPLTQAA